MPKYYMGNGKDLFWHFRNGLLSSTEYIGFLKGNIYKYTFRYNKKGQKKSDLQKLEAYENELFAFEKSLEHDELINDLKKNN